MTEFFSKPLNTLVAQDVTELVSSGWPEGYTLEYKRSLPHKSGGTDSWDQGRNEIGEYARNEILAEIVGLANSDGGYLILGIDETDDKPPRATSIVAQRQVRDLAQRFEDQARACIDPPISTLAVHPIETGGTDGVVVLKVSASRLAPHRVSTTRECFVRRGTSTVKMTMREIQEMSVGSARRTDDLEREFEVYRSKFLKWRQGRGPIAFRVTAVPLDRLPDSGRLYDGASRVPVFSLKRFGAKIGSQNIELVLAVGSWTERPMLRGVLGQGGTASGGFCIEYLQSGVIDLYFATNGMQSPNDPEKRPAMYHGWLLGGVANVLALIAGHRRRVGLGDAEYGMEVEIVGRPTNSGAIPGYIELSGGGFGQGVSYLPAEPILLPTIPVGGSEEFDSVINIIDTDIFDALGSRLGMPNPIIVSW